MNQVFALPVGEGKKASLRNVSVFALSAALGGITLGLLLAGVTVTMSQTPALLRVGLSAAVAFLAVGFQAAGIMGVFPQREAQVPRRWLLYGETRAAGAFGFILGLGVLTRLKYASAYAVLAAVVVLGKPGVAIAGGAMFGLTRGLIPLVAGRLGSIDTHVRLERWLLSPRLNLTLRAVMTTTSLAMFAIVFLHGTSA